MSGLEVVEEITQEVKATRLQERRSDGTSTSYNHAINKWREPQESKGFRCNPQPRDGVKSPA